MGLFLQVAGAVLILAAYVLAQLGRLSHRSYLYLCLNLAGSSVLAYLAAADSQWGFLLLEAVWALVSLGGIISRLRGARPQR